MAVSARLLDHESDDLVILDLYPHERRLRVTDDPPLLGYEPHAGVSFYWDDEKLERGEYEFLGIEVRDIVHDLQEEDFRALDQADAPRITVPEIGLSNVTVADALRSIRERHRRRASRRAG